MFKFLNDMFGDKADPATEKRLAEAADLMFKKIVKDWQNGEDPSQAFYWNGIDHLIRSEEEFNEIRPLVRAKMQKYIKSGDHMRTAPQWAHDAVKQELGR